MSIELLPPLSILAERVRVADRQAARRLPLLVRAQRILAGREDAEANQRRDLAEGLERWRYDYLDERRGELTSEDRLVVDALEAALHDDLAQTRFAAAKPLAWMNHYRAAAALCVGYHLELDSEPRPASCARQWT